MKALIITCYESNEERVSFIVETCIQKGYEVKVITTDFSHIKKEKRTNIPNGYCAIETKPYIKNLSFERISSHKKFAKDAFAMAEEDEYDLLWVMAPANSLIKEANKYKIRHLDTKLVIDIIDMWPESLPISISKKLLPFRIWREIRRKNINCADALVSECDLYKGILAKEYGRKIQTIHWARKYRNISTKTNLPKDKLSLCYIGSINNIIGTKQMINIINNCDMPVVLHVIGEGESRYSFINDLNKVCEVIYHGATRDEKVKDEIFAQCHAGLNIYKKNLYIGLTVKSIDYFEHGLPIINNIQGDTWKFIKEKDLGINVDERMLVDTNKIIDMRNSNKKILDFYYDNFTSDAFIKKCSKVITEVAK